MSDIKKKSLSVTECYDNLHEIRGAVMDAESYERHKAEDPALAKQAAAECLEQESNLDYIFAAPQDLRQIAARQIEADSRIEYRPECVSYTIPQFTGETCIETETRFAIGAPHMVHCGSGSYLSSGSYGSYMTSGSYRTSGSYYLTSGYYMTSGSYRTSGSFTFSGSGSFCMSAEGDADQPYMGSFTWDYDIGGYGLNLI